MREVVNRLPDEFKAERSDVAWATIKGMGNVVAHEYAMSLDMELVWEAITRRLPELGASLLAE